MRIPESNCIVCKTYKSAIHAIKNAIKNQYDIVLDLDHDLGGNKSGYDICRYLINNNIKIKGYRVHTSNPVGRNNIIQLMSRYGYKLM